MVAEQCACVGKAARTSGGGGDEEANEPAAQARALPPLPLAPPAALSVISVRISVNSVRPPFVDASRAPVYTLNVVKASWRATPRTHGPADRDSP